MSNEMREPQYDNDGELRMAKLARSSSSSRKRKSMVVDDALTSATTNNTINVTPEKSKSSADLLDNNIGTKTPASANKTTTSLSPEKAEEAEKLLLQQMRDYCSTSAVQFSRVFCEALERFYWKNISYGPAKYGADLLGSLFDKSKCGGSWNLNRLDNLLTKLEMPLPGVNQAYLYFGMWKVKKKEKFIVYLIPHCLAFLFSGYFLLACRGYGSLFHQVGMK